MVKGKVTQGRRQHGKKTHLRDLRRDVPSSLDDVEVLLEADVDAAKERLASSDARRYLFDFATTWAGEEKRRSTTYG